MSFKIADAYVEVTADATPVDILRAKLAELSNKTIGVDIGVTEAKAKIDEIRVDLEEVAREHPDITVRVDADKALLELAAVKKEMEDVDKTSTASTKNMGGMWSNLAPLILPAVQSVGQLSGALGLIPAVLAGAATAFGVAKIGIEAFKQPLDTLPPSAKATVEAVKGLGPAWDAAKSDVQAKLFQGLSTIVKQVGASDLPVLRTGLDQMATAFNSGAKDVGNWLTSTKTIGDLKTIFTNNGVAAQDFMRALQPILGIFRDLATVGSSFLPMLASHFADAAQKVADFVSHARETGQLAQWMQTGITATGKLWDTLKNLFEIIVKIASAPPLFGLNFLSILDTVSGLILKLVTNFPQLIPIIEAIVVAWKAWNIALIAWNAIMDANPISLVIIAIAALVIAIIELVKHWAEVKQAVSDAWDAIKTAVSTGMDQIKTAISTGWDQIKSAVSGAVDSVKNTISTGWDQIKSTAQGAWDAVNTTISTGWDQIKSAVSGAIDSVKSTLSSGWDQIKSTVSSTWDSIKSTINNGWNQIKSTVSSAIDSVKSTLQSGWDSAKSTATSAWNGIVSAVRSAIDTMLGVVRAIPGQIVSALGNLGNLLVNAGKSIVQGLIDGIRSMIGAVASAAAAVASAAAGAFPHSPAKFGPLRDNPPNESGAKIGQMLASGIHSSVDVVSTAAGRMAAAAGAPLGAVGTSGTGWAPGRRGRGPGAVTVNVTQLAGSPSETGRYVALALRTVG